MTILEVVRSLPLEADEVDVVGRRLDGMAFAWDRLYRVTDNGREFYEEGFKRGCATQTLRARRNTFELRDDHYDDRVGLVGFAEADDGLVFTATMDATPEGDRQLDLLRGHQKTGVSIRYGIVRNQPRSGPPWWRSQIELRELSLTGSPQYADARVLALRSTREPRRQWERPADLDAILAWTPPEI
jgi:HK97 family phage prohead protease